jgi:hypothetical protein
MHVFEAPGWPERTIDAIQEIANYFDKCGAAYQITLSCGHQCYLTGSAVVNRRTVRCQTCAVAERLDRARRLRNIAADEDAE